MKRYVFGVMVPASIAVVWSLARGEPIAPVVETEAAEGEELKERLAALERKIALNERDLQVTRRALEQAVSAPAEIGEVVQEADAGSASPSTDAYSLEDEARFFGDYFADLEAQRLAEERDSSWANEIESRAVALMASEALSGSRLTRIECAGTPCRVEAEHDDEAARLTFTRDFLFSMGPSLPEASVYSPRGARDSVLYLSRAGHLLPPPG